MLYKDSRIPGVEDSNAEFFLTSILGPWNPWTLLLLFNSFLYPFPDYICLAEGDACVIGRDFVMDEH